MNVPVVNFQHFILAVTLNQNITILNHKNQNMKDAQRAEATADSCDSSLRAAHHINSFFFIINIKVLIRAALKYSSNGRCAELTIK